MDNENQKVENIDEVKVSEGQDGQAEKEHVVDYERDTASLRAILQAISPDMDIDAELDYVAFNRAGEALYRPAQVEAKPAERRRTKPKQSTTAKLTPEEQRAAERKKYQDIVNAHRVKKRQKPHDFAGYA